MTSRRGFLGALAASFALDPKRLLWKPGAKMISIPKPQERLLRVCLYRPPVFSFSDDGDMVVGSYSESLFGFVKEADIPRLFTNPRQFIIGVHPSLLSRCEIGEVQAFA